MKEFLEILKYLLPSLVVFATAYFLIRTFLDNEVRQMKEEKKDDGRKAVIPLRFQAYERMVLFLERISPPNLVLRVGRSQESKESFQADLLRTVREEYEHNLAQQVYISDNAWRLIQRAKEEVLSDINKAAGNMTDKNTVADYGQEVISMHLERKGRAHEEALQFLKKEVREFF